MSKILKVASPAICLGLVIYLSLHISDIREDLSVVLSGNQGSPLEQTIKEKEAALFVNDAGSTMNSAYSDSVIKSMQNVSLLSEETMTLNGSVWTASETGVDGKRYILKSSSVVDVILALDSLNLYMDTMNINDLDGTVEIIVKFGGSNS